MTDTMLAFNLVEHLGGHTYEPPEGPTGFYRSLSANHGAVPTKDGWACILPYSPANVHDFFEASGHGELNADPRFSTWQAILDDMGALYSEIERIAPERSSAEWEQLCAENSIPMAEVLDMENASKSKYVKEGHLLDVAEHPTEGAYRAVGIPMKFSGTPLSIRRPAPGLGEHNAEVFDELDRVSQASTVRTKESSMKRARA